MAEGEGFEPPVPFRVQRFSRYDRLFLCQPYSMTYNAVGGPHLCSGALIWQLLCPDPRPAEIQGTARVARLKRGSLQSCRPITQATATQLKRCDEINEFNEKTAAFLSRIVKQ